MISYFNSGHPGRYLVVLFITAILWLPSILSAGFFPLPGNEVHQGLTGFAENYRGFTLTGCFILSFVVGVMLNQILKEYDLVNANNTTGLFLYVLFASAIPLFTSMNVFIIVNIFLVMFIQGMMQLSKEENPVVTIFNTSLYLGIASLFFPPLLYLFIIIWMAILMNRQMDLRNFLIVLTGLLLPFLFLFTWYFWNDTLGKHWQAILYRLISIQTLNIFTSLTVFDLVIFLLLLLVLVFSILRTFFGIGETSITARRNMKLNLYLLTGLAVLVVLYSSAPVIFLILVAPSVIVVAHAFYAVKNKWLNLIFVLLLLLIIIHQYGNYFHAENILF